MCGQGGPAKYSADIWNAQGRGENVSVRVRYACYGKVLAAVPGCRPARKTIPRVLHACAQILVEYAAILSAIGVRDDHVVRKAIGVRAAYLNVIAAGVNGFVPCGPASKYVASAIPGRERVG